MIRLLVVTLVCALAGCPATHEAEPERISVRTDVVRLAQWMSLPPSVTKVRWTVATLGVADPRTPGPTDTQLVAFLEIDDKAWPEIEKRLGQQHTQPALVPEAIAKALVPDFATLPQQEGKRVMNGNRYDAASIGKSPYHAGNATHLGKGLYVELFTR